MRGDIRQGHAMPDGNAARIKHLHHFASAFLVIFLSFVCLCSMLGSTLLFVESAPMRVETGYVSNLDTRRLTFSPGPPAVTARPWIKVLLGVIRSSSCKARA